MDAKRFDGMARLVFVAVTRRRLTRLLAGFGVSITLAAIVADDAGASKKCGSCLTKKKGKCKKKRPNGTRCPGGQCFKGSCDASCCGAGCATRCGASEVCADPPGQRCAPICDDACFARTNCACTATFDTEIPYCFVMPDPNAVCATPECDSHADCAPDAFCSFVACTPAGGRCLDSCPG